MSAITKDEIEIHNKFMDECWNLLFEAQDYIKLIETLSTDQRKRLVFLGWYFVQVGKNIHEALRVFEALNDFHEMRKFADYLLSYDPENFELLCAFLFLEDYDGVGKLLNNANVNFLAIVKYAFRDLTDPLFDYVKKFLKNNRTPVATGAINMGIDLIAIKNLAQEYDIAVPIARGGLYQGAIANLWNMPIRIADISAHNRKKPRGRWINPVKLEDFTGKRVLLFDKDFVSGATVRKALSMLLPLNPAKIGIYFTHNPISATPVSNLPRDLQIYYPSNAPLQNAGDAYIEAHEKLGTLYGRQRLTRKLINEEVQEIEEQFPKLSKALNEFTDKQFQLFNSLNPCIPAIQEIRESILLRVDRIIKEHQDHIANDVFNLIPDLSHKLEQILNTTQLFPADFDAIFLKERYGSKQEEAAKRRNIENCHCPSNALASFIAAKKAVEAGFDMAIIVGPEGFTYEPYFDDLGIQTVAVNIPESRENEPRTIQLLDDLSVLEGRNVLVVEDDVRTGATLQKLLDHLKSFSFRRLGLYLGQSENFQILSNIPKDFNEIFMADENDQSAGEEFRKFLESKGINIFK